MVDMQKCEECKQEFPPMGIFRWESPFCPLCGYPGKKGEDECFNCYRPASNGSKGMIQSARIVYLEPKVRRVCSNCFGMYEDRYHGMRRVGHK